MTQQPNTPTTETPAKAKQASVQELVESLRGVADDVGQISELTSEEKSLVAEFFKALLNFMNPLSQGISINPAIIHSDNDIVQNAHIDPTGHLALLFEDGHLELKDLSEEKNRDLMITVVQDAIPKFKQLTNQQKRKVENRIKFLSAITKDMQKISGALAAVSGSQ